MMNWGTSRHDVKPAPSLLNSIVPYAWVFIWIKLNNIINLVCKVNFCIPLFCAAPKGLDHSALWPRYKCYHTAHTSTMALPRHVTSLSWYSLPLVYYYLYGSTCFVFVIFFSFESDLKPQDSSGANIK